VICLQVHAAGVGVVAALGRLPVDGRFGPFGAGVRVGGTAQARRRPPRAVGGAVERVVGGAAQAVDGTLEARGRHRPAQDDVHALPAGRPPLPPEVWLRGGLHRGHDPTRPEGQLHLPGHWYDAFKHTPFCPSIYVTPITHAQ